MTFQGPLLNRATRLALYANVAGYGGEEGDRDARIAWLKRRYQLTQVHRFDLGQNCDGCAPRVAARLEQLMAASDVRVLLSRYPSAEPAPLRQKLADLHQIDPSWICLSAGIEQAIALVAATFLDPDDRVVVSQPSFYVFENFSRRVGALPLRLPLREADHFDWTARTHTRLREALSRRGAKLIWLASPNNPTGRALPDALLEDIVGTAARYGATVVLDEAYGEYLDPPSRVRSGSRLLGAHDNLIVLRGFSKAFGLAGIRVGYCMASHPEVVRALRAQSNAHPLTWLSLEIASAALDHLDYLELTRARTRQRRDAFMQLLDQLPQFSTIPSSCSIVLLRHRALAAAELKARLERLGVLLARVPGAGAVSDRYLRVSLGRDLDNMCLVDALTEAGEGSAAEPSAHWWTAAAHGRRRRVDSTRAVSA